MILISEQAIDAAALARRFMDGIGDAGAVVTFSGIVRRDGAKEVEALFLDHAPGLTEREIEKAEATATARWSLTAALVVHRVGRVEKGETVVFVAAASKHRRDAFDACDFMMDYLKADAPFWKKQSSREGDEWIEPRAADYADRERWR